MLLKSLSRALLVSLLFSVASVTVATESQASPVDSLQSTLIQTSVTENTYTKAFVSMYLQNLGNHRSRLICLILGVEGRR